MSYANCQLQFKLKFIFRHHLSLVYIILSLTNITKADNFALKASEILIVNYILNTKNGYKSPVTQPRCLLDIKSIPPIKNILIIVAHKVPLSIYQRKDLC